MGVNFGDNEDNPEYTIIFEVFKVKGKIKVITDTFYSSYLHNDVYGQLDSFPSTTIEEIEKAVPNKIYRKLKDIEEKQNEIITNKTR